MNIIHRSPAHADERGIITDVLQGQSFDGVTVVTSNRGVRRGDHYHIKSTQLTYLVSGRLTAFTQQEGEAVESAEMFQGDMLVSPPKERHALIALEDSIMVVIIRGPRGKDYEGDTVRVEPLEVEP